MPPRIQQRGQLRAAFVHELHVLFSLVNFTCKTARQDGAVLRPPLRSRDPPDSPKTLTAACGGLRRGSSRARRRSQAFRSPPLPNQPPSPAHPTCSRGLRLPCAAPLGAPARLPPPCPGMAPACRPCALRRPAWPRPRAAGCLRPSRMAACSRTAGPAARVARRLATPPRNRERTKGGRRPGGGGSKGPPPRCGLRAPGSGWGGRQAAGPGGRGHRRAPSLLPEALPLFAGAVLLGAFIFPVVVLSLRTTRVKYSKNPSCFS